MKIREIVTREAEVISPDATICDAARKMKQNDIGMLPVCGNGRIVGAITDRDIAIRAVADGADPLHTKVAEIMTTKVCWCFEDDDVESAAKLMEREQIRRLPVLNSQKHLVGIISVGDLAVRNRDEHLTEEVMECVCQPA